MHLDDEELYTTDPIINAFCDDFGSEKSDKHFLQLSKFTIDDIFVALKSLQIKLLLDLMTMLLFLAATAV